MNRLMGALLSACACLAIAGCQKDDMWTQAKVGPLGETEFFGDGRGAREPAPGTVSSGSYIADKLLAKGIEEGKPAQRFPYAIDAKTLDLGKARYDTFCAPCHGALGDGVAILVQRGYRKPAPLADPRLLRASPGELFLVMDVGVPRVPDPHPDILAGTGYDLKDVVHPVLGRKVSVRERWAIVAWMRVLQTSQHFEVKDLAPNEVDKIPARRSDDGNR